jgi:hemerythrin-like domain-containing protein
VSAGASPRPTRRDLLVGGAGLVVGAAAAGGGVAAAGDPAAPAEAPGYALASANEALMTEHGVLKRVLLAYRAAADRLAPLPSTAAPGSTSAPSVTGLTAAVTEAAQVIQSYVESFHEGLEEAYVFPRVRGTEPDLVRTLLVQHDRGRHLTARILSVAGTGLRTGRARAQVRADLLAFVTMYEPHEAWEDTVLYPTLRRISTPRLLGELAERFAELENRQFGHHALAQVLHRVEGVEQRLGIADLAAFTPGPTT